jgi:hypothetical protein
MQLNGTQCDLGGIGSGWVNPSCSFFYSLLKLETNITNITSIKYAIAISKYSIGT